MIQLLPILLVAVVLAADGGLASAGFGSAAAIACAWAPMLASLAALGIAVRWCTSRMAMGQVPGPVIFAERAMRWCIALIVLTHAASVLAFGWLDAVRSVTGDLILLDELVALLPPLVGILGTWWLYYPVERRLREALLIRRLDEGAPVYPVPGRARYVVAQARLHLLLLLVPILMILALDELIGWAFTFAPDRLQSPLLADGLTLASGVCVFISAPVLARAVLSLRRLPDGPLRRDLEVICARHGVKVRDFLLWGTGGTMINAAVMGLVGRLRYVMISDALIESMPREQVLAVMAHEVGHVRRHHMGWMVLTLIALLGGFELLIGSGRWILAESGAAPNVWPPDLQQPLYEGIWTVLGLIGALWLFGWVSRRFERQADTFAVQHLSGLAAGEQIDGQTEDAWEPAHADLPNPEPGTVSQSAVGAMIGALHTVSRLNCVNPRRHSWRHGSITWRTGYLRRLAGQPLDALAIDRQVRWIKRGSGLILLAVLGFIVWADWPLIVDAMRSAAAFGES